MVNRTPVGRALTKNPELKYPCRPKTGRRTGSILLRTRYPGFSTGTAKPSRAATSAVEAGALRKNAAREFCIFATTSATHDPVVSGTSARLRFSLLKESRVSESESHFRFSITVAEVRTWFRKAPSETVLKGLTAANIAKPP